MPRKRESREHGGVMKSLKSLHRPTGACSTVAVFRRSPQACAMQLGLLTELPDPCSSTAFQPRRLWAIWIRRYTVWVCDLCSGPANLLEEGTSVVSVFSFWCTYRDVACTVRNGNVLLPPRTARDSEVVVQARQAMSPYKFQVRLFATSYCTPRGV